MRIWVWWLLRTLSGTLNVMTYLQRHRTRVNTEDRAHCRYQTRVKVGALVEQHHRHSLLRGCKTSADRSVGIAGQNQTDIELGGVSALQDNLTIGGTGGRKVVLAGRRPRPRWPVDGRSRKVLAFDDQMKGRKGGGRWPPAILSYYVSHILS